MGLDRGLYLNTTCCNEGGKNRLEVVKKSSQQELIDVDYKTA